MAAGLCINLGSLVASLPRQERGGFASNATLASGDLVNLESAQLEVASAGDFILGQIIEDATSSSTGVVVDITPFMVVVMDNDNIGTTFAATHPGQYFDIIGGTGAQLVDTSSADATYTGPSGQLICLEYNPQNVRDDLNSDISVGKYLLNPKERQFI